MKSVILAMVNLWYFLQIMVMVHPRILLVCLLRLKVLRIFEQCIPIFLKFNFSKTFRFIILIVPYLGIFGGDGLMGLGRTALPAIESVTVENENIVQVKSMTPAALYLQKYIKRSQL